MTPLADDAALLAQLYPTLWHVTDYGNADGILRNGLLSTQALLSLFDVPEAARAGIVQRPRQQSHPLRHAELGEASIRDQLPLSLNRLAASLTDMSVEEWLQRLNSLVFFWPTLERVRRLLQAPVYAARDHHVLVVETSALVARHGHSILLSAINTGATRPFAHPRGRDSFLPLGAFPLQERRRRIGRAGAVAEVTVPGEVPDIAEFVIAIERWSGPECAEVLWSRARP